MEITVKSTGRTWKIEAPENFWIHYLTLLSESRKLNRREGFNAIAFDRELEYTRITDQLEGKEYAQVKGME